MDKFTRNPPALAVGRFNKPYILVVRQLGGVGDCLMLSCVARGLKEKYPEHNLFYVTAEIYLGGALMDVATHNPLWNQIFAIEPYDITSRRTKAVWGRWFGSGTPEIENELLWKMADKAFCLNTACVDKEWPELKSPGGVVTPRYVAWCDHAGVAPSSYAPLYKVTEEERKVAKAYAAERWAGKTVVGLGLSACEKKRALGIGKLEAICKALTAAGLHPVTIDPTCSIPGFDYLVGKRIRDLMPLIEQMSCVISVDSGILHMAGAVGTPVVGLFGPTDQAMRMGNYLGSAVDCHQLIDCAPCWYNFPCDGRQWFHHQPFECITRIPVSGIVEETLRWVKHRQDTRFMV